MVEGRKLEEKLEKELEGELSYRVLLLDVILLVVMFDAKILWAFLGVTTTYYLFIMQRWEFLDAKEKEVSYLTCLVYLIILMSIADLSRVALWFLFVLTTAYNVLLCFVVRLKSSRVISDVGSETGVIWRTLLLFLCLLFSICWGKSKLVLWSLLGLTTIISLFLFNFAKIKMYFQKGPDGPDGPKELSVAMSHLSSMTSTLVSNHKMKTIESLLHQAQKQGENLLEKHDLLKRMMERDKLAYGSHTARALNETERVMCANIFKMVNYADLCSDEDQLPRYERNELRIKDYISRNKELLDTCGELIAKTLDYGDGKVDSADAKSIDIKATLDVLKDLLRMLGQDEVA